VVGESANGEEDNEEDEGYRKDVVSMHKGGVRGRIINDDGQVAGCM